MTIAEEIARLRTEQLARFGQAVIYTRQGGPAVSLTAIFDETVDAREGGRFAGRLWVRVADLPSGAAKLDVVAVGGAAYRVSNEPLDDMDGAGGCWLKLRKQ